jgi:hypothetical protein
LNAWFLAGIGLPLFQQMIPRPGLSTGLYMNTRRIGSIVSDPIIAIGSLTALGNAASSRQRRPHPARTAIITIANRTATKSAPNDQLSAST